MQSQLGGLGALNLSISSAQIWAWVVFGLIGMAAFGYGKKQRRPRHMVLGGLLMAYPYCVSDTVLLWLVGAGLTSLLFI